VDDVGGCVALCPFVNVAPLRCDRANSTVTCVVCLGGRCVRVGGVEVLDGLEGQGGGRGWGVSYCWWVLGWHPRLGWGRRSGYRLNDY
jgi:hypothetical protein